MSVESVELREVVQRIRQLRVVDATECEVHFVPSMADLNVFHWKHLNDGFRSFVCEVVSNTNAVLFSPFSCAFYDWEIRTG
jgi:hypothetical protein